MGTYTTNKELFMPTVGEQGWGELVNNNFSTIDNFLKPITVSGSTYTFTGNQTGGSVSATNITNSGTLTNTGKITANGGIGTTTLTASSTSTFTGKLTANGGIGTKALTTTSISNGGNITNTGTLTSTGKIYANGGLEIEGDVVGNVTGKFNISSLSDETNNLKVCELSCTSKSGSFTLGQGNNTSISLSSSDYTLTKYNTSIINFTPGDTTMKELAGTTICTIGVDSPSSTNVTYSVTVKNMTDNTTVLSTSVTAEKGGVATTEFSRIYSKSYSVIVKQSTNLNGSNPNVVTITTPVVDKYVP